MIIKKLNRHKEDFSEFLRGCIARNILNELANNKLILPNTINEIWNMSGLALNVFTNLWIVVLQKNTKSTFPTQTYTIHRAYIRLVKSLLIQ